ncbi:DDE-type integrase/transposase/recombinase [Porphyromonas cangingivalis]|uniref:DDE-type integrase/transposase/recombinase n=1 Tax=Porphyromonas cangingivalis TaxID=36874 RepID=UPI00068DA876
MLALLCDYSTKTKCKKQIDLQVLTCFSVYFLRLNWRFIGQYRNRNSHLYLSLVTDAYSKKVMGYNLSDSLDTKGSLNALKMALRHRLYRDERLIHHSDRGIQYCSESYRKLLKQYDIIPSMTESYDPYANAIAERVNGILKQEFMLEHLDLPLQEMEGSVRKSV